MRRAVLAGLEITREVARLSEQAKRRFGIEIAVRVGVHRGLVYLDTAQDDVYGLAANLAARVSGLAPPGAVVVSDAVEPLIRNDFELEARPRGAGQGCRGADHPLPRGRVSGPSRPGSGRGPLVGRDRELARLEKSWARAQAGTLTTPGVVFRGEPGIGKSRLAAAAAELVEASGAVVLELAGSPFHTDAGLHPVRTLLERRCGIDRLTDQAERLRLLDAEVPARGLDPVSVVPLLAPVLGIGAEAGYEPAAAEGRKLYELIARGGADLSAGLLRRWCGAGGRRGCALVRPVHPRGARRAAGRGRGRLLVVITGRPGGWLPAGWPVKVFDLTPLTDEQTDELITALDPTLTAEDRAAVAGRCDGVPFYIEQVVAGLNETGVPEALYEPLFARLRASANVVPVVEAAAVIGRQMDRGLLCSVVDLSDDEVDDVIDELEDALVLEPWGTDGWRFRHELLREVAAELAPPSVRRGLHAKVADALIGAGGDPDWRLVAGHYEQAERFDEAASAYQQASSGCPPSRRAGRGPQPTSPTPSRSSTARTPGPDRDRREIAAAVGAGVPRRGRGGLSKPRRRRRLRAVPAAGRDRPARRRAIRDVDRPGGLLHRACRPAPGSPGARVAARRPRAGAAVVPSGDRGQFGVVAWLRGEFDAACSPPRGGPRRAGPQQISTRLTRCGFMPSDPIATAHIHLALTHLVRGDLAGAEAELAQAARRAERARLPPGPVQPRLRALHGESGCASKPVSSTVPRPWPPT